MQWDVKVDYARLIEQAMQEADDLGTYGIGMASDYDDDNESNKQPHHPRDKPLEGHLGAKGGTVRQEQRAAWY